MKEAIIIGLDGFYVEPVIVPLTEQGVTEIYETPEPPELEEGEEPQTPEPNLVGYRVAVPVPPGLYKPRWDIAAWQAALEDYDEAVDIYHDALTEYDPEGEDPEPQPPAPVDLTAFWVEGLTPQEIDDIVNAPQPPSELDIIGGQLVQRELETLELRGENQMLGQQIVDLELRLLALEGSAGA